jgi:outer membrane murein-binding lipoprotein Lpp
MRRFTTAIVLIALSTAAFAASTSSARDEHASSARALNARQAAFHDDMRKLWEDHITWTRLAIVTHRRQPPDRPAARAHPRRGGPPAGGEVGRQ